MRIKKFIASNIQEGRGMVERELGSDAIILSNRNVKLSNGTSAIEIVAALDNKNITANKNKANIYANSTVINPAQKEKVANEITKKLISEIASLKDLVNDISENVKYKYTGTMSPNLARIFKILRNSDISEEVALELIGRITMKGFANDFNQAIGEARRTVLNRLTFTNPIAKIESKQVISFLGPTGSGKTTSLIKLAIVCKLLHKARILIVSTDTYKVGGIEQLQTLASISGITFATAYTPEELKIIIKEENKYDMIMIDTVGRSPNNIKELENIAEFQKAAQPNLTFLVLSAAASEATLLNSINKFQKAVTDAELSTTSVFSIIITKVDEAAGLGNIVSALNNKKLPLSYFATGQNIPDDIEPANSEKLNNYLFIV